MKDESEFADFCNTSAGQYSDSYDNVDLHVASFYCPLVAAAIISTRKQSRKHFGP